MDVVCESSRVGGYYLVGMWSDFGHRRFPLKHLREGGETAVSFKSQNRKLTR